MYFDPYVEVKLKYNFSLHLPSNIIVNYFIILVLLNVHCVTIPQEVGILIKNQAIFFIIFFLIWILYVGNVGNSYIVSDVGDTGKTRAAL